ncbi:MAG: membrane lipoprotein lipid attachment site-containing protein [Oscillospiraceae bacterium]|nr:membrane lipoprotein lipid attachment site-containing protein [Oscillospiraceae bacterium]
MKKLWIILLATLVLSGCSKKDVLETVTDVQDTPAAVVAQRIQLYLPQELSAPVLQNEESGALYLCEDYAVSTQVLESGDLNKTIRSVTGMEKDSLQIIETKKQDSACYQWVWATGGENGIQLGRGCVLDDGVYHYVLTAQANEEAAGKIQDTWNEIFTSFSLATEREEISTGS